MGERDWFARYRDARAYADDLAHRYAAGETLSQWRYKWVQMPGEPEPPRETLQGAAYVAWAYELAALDAATLMQVKGKHWQTDRDVCLQLQRMYEQQAAEEHVNE